MGRLVRGAVARRAGGAGLESARGGEGEMESAYGGPDNYLERVIKYIPSEVVAAYVALDGIFFKPGTAELTMTTSTVDPATGQTVVPAADIFSGLPSSYVAAGIFLICLVFTPLYIWTRSRMPGEVRGTSWRLQALISTVCFVVWAYATKGSLFLGASSVGLFGGVLYNGQLAAALLILYTLVSGLFKPGSEHEGS